MGGVKLVFKSKGSLNLGWAAELGPCKSGAEVDEDANLAVCVCVSVFWDFCRT